MSSHKIQAFVRSRPLKADETNKSIVIVPERDAILIQDNNASFAHEERSFRYDKVFPLDATQEEVYDAVKPLVEQVLVGYNCTLFAYGQTGTGKTYTMEGWKDRDHCGVIPRAINQICESLNGCSDEHSIRVSFQELYNEDIYDLLTPPEDMTKLKIFEDQKKSIIIAGLTETTIESGDQIYEILERGQRKRQNAATLLNACSSRSHTIFTITVETKVSAIDGANQIREGKLNLVDLAGSESIGRSGAQNKQAREAGNINQSLLVLGRVISALAEKGSHVPYRESKLTRILRDSLGGRAKTSIIVTISPADVDLFTTISTLDYASRARNIINVPELNQRPMIRTTLEFNREIQALIQQHVNEMNDLEIRIRNEVALEFKREMKKMEQLTDEQNRKTRTSYEQDLQAMRQKFEDQIDKLERENEDITRAKCDLEKACEELRRISEELRKAHEEEQEKRSRSSLEYVRLAEELDLVKRERDNLMKELEDRLAAANAPLREIKSEESADDRKRARKIRREPHPEDFDEYANITFDDGEDDLIPQSAKKRKKVTNGPRQRLINAAITLSGKKQRSKIDDFELSPEEIKSKKITKAKLKPNTPVARVTRSRANKKLFD